MTDPYLHNREFFGTVSGNYRILTGDTGLIVLVPAIPAHTLFIQKLHIEVTTITGAELWTFQDGAAIPIVPSVSAAAVAHFDFDFGPDGVPCTQATAFVLNITGAVGAIGWVSWEAFKKLTLGTAASAGGGAPAPGDFGSQTVVIAKPGIGTVSTDGLVLVNPTPATAAVPNQISPRLRFEAQSWDSDDAVSRPVRMAWDVSGIDGPTVKGQMTLRVLDPVTGALTGVLVINTVGNVNCNRLDVSTGSVLGPVSVDGSTGFIGSANGAFIYFTADGRLRLDDFNSFNGVGLDFAANGTLKLRNRLFNGDGQFSAGTVRGNAVTFANLPAAPVEGMLAAVTDSTVNTWGTVIAGGGANHVLAYYNGTNWIVK